MSEIFLDLIGRLAVIYIGILFGFILNKTRLSSDYWKGKITKLNIVVIFPITIFFALASMSISTDFLIIAQILLCAFLVHVMGYIWTVFANSLWLSNRPNTTKGAVTQVSTFPNALIYPFPIILALVGEEGLFSATLFLIMALVLRNSLGIMIGSQYSSDRHHISLKKVVRKVLLFPPFLAMIVSFLFLVVVGPQDFSNVIIVSWIKNIATFSALIMIGLTIRLPESSKNPNHNDSRLVNESSIVETRFFEQLTPAIGRFVICPVLALVLVFVFGFPGLLAIPLLIQAAAPPAVNNIIYSEFLGFDATTVSQSITILTVVALIILPLELLLISIFFPLF
ncbi:MAG: AEC family transporter [Promethearchaeota archaeon]